MARVHTRSPFRLGPHAARESNSCEYEYILRVTCLVSKLPEALPMIQANDWRAAWTEGCRRSTM